MSIEEADVFRKSAFNRMYGVSSVILKGRNAAISNSAETIWSPGSTYAQLTSAVAFEVVSSSANDTSAGTGARTVSIDLIDGNYTKSTVTVTMNGATPVAVSGTYVACNGIRILTAGSGLVNAGTIDVRTVSGSTVKRRLNSSLAGMDDNFIYTIPASHVGLLSSVSYSVTGTTDDILVHVRTQDSAGVINVIGQSNLEANGSDVIFFGDGVVIAEKTLIEMRAITTAGAGDLIAQAQLHVVNVAAPSLSIGPNGFGI